MLCQRAEPGELSNDEKGAVNWIWAGLKDMFTGTRLAVAQDLTEYSNLTGLGIRTLLPTYGMLSRL